jgi:hypothetical protein
MLPPLRILANYRAAAHRDPQNRASDGRSKKEDFAFAP